MIDWQDPPKCNDVIAGFFAGLRRIPSYTVSEWARRYRILSGKAAAEPGRYRPERTPYLIEIQDRLSDNDPAHTIIFMKGSQIGATEIGNNWVGYTIHVDPSPMMMVQPTVETIERTSKLRIKPMIETCPELAEKVRPARSRDSGNTTLLKEFTGGILVLSGANSSASLRSVPMKKLFPDEIDEYPEDVDNQGDPLELVKRRAGTFQNRKLYCPSTPTVRGKSRIEKLMGDTGIRRYFVPCPHCGGMDWIRWGRIFFEDNDPNTARLICEDCGSLIEEHHKNRMLAKGEWRPIGEEKPGVYKYHYPGLGSPSGLGFTWAECVQQFLDAAGDSSKMKVWVNTILGETWEEDGDKADPADLMARVEDYPAEVPAGVGALTSGVDVQADRLEIGVKGWGDREESWLIAYHVIYGDPGQDAIWFELDKFLQTRWTHQSGKKMMIDRVMIDSGGKKGHTEMVYKFVKARPGKPYFAVKGASRPGRELISKVSRNNVYRVPLHLINTESAKDVIYARLKIQFPGPGFMHLPEGIDPEYLAMLTGETKVLRYRKGRQYREYVPNREQVEALDCEVYALAALYSMGVQFIKSLGARAAEWNQPPPPEKKEIKQIFRPHKRNWANNF